MQFHANTDAVDHNGQTPLYYAARAGKYEAAEFLIKHGGANVNHEDKKQQTPMHIAKNNNKQSIMNLLMQYGARGLEDLRKQQNKLKDKVRNASQNQPSYNEMVPLQNI